MSWGDFLLATAAVFCVIGLAVVLGLLRVIGWQEERETRLRVGKR